MMQLASTAQLRAALMRWALVLVPGVLLLGFLSGTMAGSGPANAWFAALAKPAIYPPAATFGIVWSVLYVMMGFALAVVVVAWGARGRGAAVGMFAAQLVVNLAWSPVFFAMHRITLGLVVLGVLDVLVVATIVMFHRVRPMAAWLLVPYLVWALFATVLNWQFLQLNPGADGQSGGSAVVRMQIGN